MTRRRASTSAPPSGDAHIVVTDAIGPVSLLLRSQTPVGVNPITGLGQVVTTGDTAERADQRTPQVIIGNQQGGGSQFWYTETEGVETFTDSECDTRFPGIVVLPPRPISRGVLASASTAFGVWLEGLTNGTNPTIFGYRYSPSFTPQYYDGTSWASITGAAAGCFAFVRFNGKYVICNTTGIFHSTVGNAWMAGLTGSIRAIVAHDNKIFAMTSAGVFQAHTDPTATVGWTAFSTLLLLPTETISQLFEWRDASGRTVIYCLTSWRLLWYDEDADVWHLFYDFGETIAEAARPTAFVWRRDGNLYVTLGQGTDARTSDTVVWFSGTTNITSPNRYGGLPTSSRTALMRMSGGLNWLFGWGRPRWDAAGTLGRTYIANDQQGWHTIYGPLATDTEQIVGGGYYRGRLWTVNSATSVFEQDVADNVDSPLFATERTYRTGSTFYHEYAFTDLGTPNMDKQALWVTVKSLDHTSANKVPGLAAGCTISVEIRRDTDTSWTSLGTLTSGMAFPNVLPINGGAGLKGKQFKVRIGLASSNASNSPMVTSVALALLRQEDPRYAYTCVVDMSRGDHALYRGQDRAQLRERMRGWARPGNLVRLDFAGGDYANAPATATTVQNCVVQWSGQEDPESGPGTYSLVFSDFSYPASG